jgi:2-polyprenyl-6-methoxyphenol hydroxylase-like FAD-dependent oxidoreductase
MLDIPVLISGGGPVGLTASLLLSQLGVRSLLVERHPGTALTPKARGINARTMEIFRQCGIDSAIREAGLTEGRLGLIVWTETLAGKEIERRVPGRATAKNMAATPVRNCLCAQDDLEPVIRRFAEAAGGPGALRFNTELTSFSQEPDAVTGMLTDRTTEAEIPFKARYLIAAEGAQSRVRRALGVPGRSHPMGRTSAGRAVFCRAGRAARHLPHHQRQGSLGFPDPQPEKIRLAAAGLHAGILCDTDPQRRRRTGPSRIGARRRPMGSVCHRCRPLSRRRRFPGRRRGA